MMKTVRKELSPGVFFNYIHATKFKTGLLSAQLVVPLDAARASAGALLPAVLRRGTARHGDMLALSRALDLLYGAGLSFTVRKKGENQCLGFPASFIDDRFAFGGEKLLEPTAALLGEVLLRPATEGGVFRRDYVDGEKDTPTSACSRRCAALSATASPASARRRRSPRWTARDCGTSTSRP